MSPLRRASLVLLGALLFAGVPALSSDSDTTLGKSAFKRGEYDSAEKHFRKALAGARKAGDPVRLIEALENMGAFHRAKGDHEPALPLFREALRLRESRTSPVDTSLLVDLDNLCEIAAASDDPDTEKVYAARILSVKLAEAKGTEAEKADFLRQSGAAYRDRKVIEPARLLLETALERAKRAFPGDAARLSEYETDLGRLHMEAAEYSGCVKWLSTAMKSVEKAFGRDSVRVVAVIDGLGTCQRRLNRPAVAEALYLRSMAIVKKEKGPEHPSVGILLNNIGAIYEDRGRLPDARDAYEKALKIREKTIGRESPRLLVQLQNLGAVNLNLDAAEPALGLYGRALKISEKAYGPSDLRVVEPLTGLAAAEIKRGNYQEAIRHKERAAGILEKNLGPEDPKTIRVREDIGRIRDYAARMAEESTDGEEPAPAGAPPPAKGKPRRSFKSRLDSGDSGIEFP